MVSPSSSGIGQAVVLHQTLDVSVKRQVVASKFPPLTVLLRRDHVEAVRALSFLSQGYRRPTVLDGLDQLGHDRIVSPPSHQPETGAFEISLRNCSLDFVARILSMSSSSAAAGSSTCRTRRSRHTSASSSFDMSSSSLRVLEASTLMAGKMRFSDRPRSRRVSQFPVPLNSSKMPSSIREPV